MFWKMLSFALAAVGVLHTAPNNKSKLTLCENFRVAKQAGHQHRYWLGTELKSLAINPCGEQDNWQGSDQ